MLSSFLYRCFVLVVHMIAALAVESRTGDKFVAVILAATFFLVGIVDAIVIFLVTKLSLIKMLYGGRWFHQFCCCAIAMRFQYRPANHKGTGANGDPNNDVLLTASLSVAYRRSYHCHCDLGK
jgi:hypothetical protein